MNMCVCVPYVSPIFPMFSFFFIRTSGSLAAFSERRAEEAWALLDLIELQSAAEVRASALAPRLM